MNEQNKNTKDQEPKLTLKQQAMRAAAAVLAVAGLTGVAAIGAPGPDSSPVVSESPAPSTAEAPVNTSTSTTTSEVTPTTQSVTTETTLAVQEPEIGTAATETREAEASTTTIVSNPYNPDLPAITVETPAPVSPADPNPMHPADPDATPNNGQGSPPITGPENVNPIP